MARQARRDILGMSFQAQVGHIPSALSMIDYLTVLFDYADPRRDRLILGKPFGAQAYYAVFSARGWIEPKWELYGRSYREWSYIIDRNHPLIHFIDDTMGNALAVACGVAHGCDARVYVNYSDAALQEGTSWEAIQYAGACGLNNLLVTIDNNDMQMQGRVSEICPVEPIDAKFALSGWRTYRCNGHDVEAIDEAFRAVLDDQDRPVVMIFDTTKGKGVSFMEGNSDWHYRKLDVTSLAIALRDLL